MFNRRQTGIDGERAGADFLRKSGYRILQRNFRTPYGEIDIIARHKETLVFIEVKRRRNCSFGRPQEAVGRQKQEHIVRSALHYVKMERIKGVNIRFDVLAIGPGDDAIELICSAFSADGYTY
jgi:putative endonuclease